ncbi:MAG: homoserine kinase [Thermoleophilia bacterium]|nr:homoserine kinase [Thermoleophilia bacterium]
MTVRVVAPASTANLGPGFDTAAAALELWNEVTVEEGTGVEIEGEGSDELPRDASHLTLRAFALFAPPGGYRFSFVNRVPLERGLGSSAAAIAMGLVAGAAVAGRPGAPGDLLQAGVPIEGHADNLAAALYGGVCFAMKRNGSIHAARIASDMPVAAILAVPATRTNTGQSRGALPATVTHADAAHNAASAALLGAAIAGHDARLLRDAFDDRLHEQYRAADAPLLRTLRAGAPDGTVGVTLSGSGPSVVVWAEADRAGDVARELEASLPDDTTVLPLRVAREGAHAV